MLIICKSNLENYEKEKSSIKCNTVRQLDGNDIIRIENKVTQTYFERTITDITTYKGNIIISWKE